MGKKRSVNETSIIGGADGPTSIFIAGRDRHGKRPLKVRVKQYLYQRRRAKVEARIPAHPHTMEEVRRYLVAKYHAKEVSKEERIYQEEYQSLREALILQHQPELLGEDAKIERPKSMEEQDLRAFWARLEERTQKVCALPEEIFPLDFHIYQICLSGERTQHVKRQKRSSSKKAAAVTSPGTLRVTLESTYGILGCSYSGEKKAMKELSRISRQIYWYYGVTKADIEQKTKRYQHLVTALSS